MTVTTSTARVVHNGNGTTIDFAVPFRFLENAHVAVFLRDAAGGQVQWTENTQYALAGADAASGGTLTVITSPTDHTPASGEKLFVIRAVPITQETDYVENDAFPAETHERAIDKLTMVNQEQTERLDRTFTIPETDLLAENFVLPGDIDRALKFLAFDSVGNPIVSIGTAAGQSVPFTMFGQGWVATVSADSARALLGDAPIVDDNGNELVSFAGIAMAVNEVTIGNAATGGRPKFSATGGDADVGLDYQTKGAGVHQLLDGSGNEVLKTAAGVADAVNELEFANAATGNGPEIRAVGGDTNIDVEIVPKGTGTLLVNGSDVLAGGLSLATPTATTSGTSVDITTGIPSAAKRIQIIFDGVSSNGATQYEIKLGTSGGIEETGYDGFVARIQTSALVGAAWPADAISAISSPGPTHAYDGAITLHLQDAATNTWKITGQLAETGTNSQIIQTAGTKALSGTLDRFRLTTANGTDTFDAGSISVLAES